MSKENKVKDLESQVKVLIDIHKEDRHIINEMKQKVEHYEDMLFLYSEICRDLKKINLKFETLDALDNMAKKIIKYDDLSDEIKNELVKMYEERDKVKRVVWKELID